MKYYRLIFKKAEDGVVEWSNIIEQEMNQEDFEKMNWTKPIVKHNFDGMIHFISLDSNYLDAMILGVFTYKELESTIY